VVAVRTERMEGWRWRSTAGLRPRAPRRAAPLIASDFVAIPGFTSVDVLTVGLASMGLGAVVVRLSCTASPAQLAPIVVETGPRGRPPAWSVGACAER
jgi:long-subunit acyl-CoA synthetase (AMP-forming)